VQRTSIAPRVTDESRVIRLNIGMTASAWEKGLLMPKSEGEGEGVECKGRPALEKQQLEFGVTPRSRVLGATREFARK
jgi:hypothetical protein